jgi:hypothetical protein
MAIPILYWMLECTACGSRLVVHDSYLKFDGTSNPNPLPGDGYGGAPLPERYKCTKGCSRPNNAGEIAATAFNLNTSEVHAVLISPNRETDHDN